MVVQFTQECKPLKNDIHTHSDYPLIFPEKAVGDPGCLFAFGKGKSCGAHNSGTAAKYTVTERDRRYKH